MQPLRSQFKSTYQLLFIPIFICLLICIYPEKLIAKEKQSAQIISIKGQGEWRKNFTAKWDQTVLKQSLYPGSIVRTLKKSKMALLFSDESQIRLHQNSMMVIKQILNKNNKRTHLYLNKGRAWSKSKNIPKQLLFSTPTAVAAIRGTDWEMAVDENGNSKLTVLHGEIDFYNEFGSIVVKKDEQAIAEKGKAPVKIIITNPKQRVQWVSHYPIEPMRYLKLSSVPIDQIKQQLKNKHLAQIDLAQLLFDSGNIQQAKEILTQLNNEAVEFLIFSLFL